MTTIAFDGYTVASDTLVTRGHLRMPGAFTKVICVDDVLYGITGFFNQLHPWIKAYQEWDRCWDRCEASPLKAPECRGDDLGGHFLVFDGRRGENWSFYIESPYAQKVEPKTAWGSGAPFAMGAMCYGASAFRAVKIASDLDIYTGGEIVTWDVASRTRWSIDVDPGEGNPWPVLRILTVGRDPPYDV